MELDIAALSMNMAAANLQQGVSIGMMKKTMESTQQTMETMSEHDGQTWAAQKWAVFF